MSNKARNILYGVFVAIIVAALVWLLISERMRNIRIAEENSKIAESIEQEDSGKRSDGEKIYEELEEALSDASVGFACIGDGEMVGYRQESLPNELDSMINDELFGQIESDIAKKTRFVETRAIKIDVANIGTLNEDMNAILARCGAHKILTAEGFDMPSGVDKVNVEMKDEDGNILYFAKQDNVKFGIVTIEGVEGHFYTADESYDDVHIREDFKREKTGTGFRVSAGTEVETEGAAKYRDHYPVMFFGEQQDVSADAFVSDISDIIEAYGDSEHYAVVCTTAAGSEYDTALEKAFGDRYFRNEKHAEDMTGADYEALASQIYESFDSQGVFDAIKEAVRSAGKKLP